MFNENKSKDKNKNKNKNKDNINKDKIKIDVMTLDDLNEIKDILYSEFDDLYSYEIFKTELVNNNSIYLVLRYDDKIISYAGIKIIIDEAELMNIVTKKDKQRLRLCKIYSTRNN